MLILFFIQKSSILFHVFCSNMAVKFVEKDEENNYNHNNSLILKRELEKWKTYSDILRKPNKDLFNQMLQLSYKYLNALNAKGENYATESLLMSLLLEQYKIRMNFFTQ